MHQKDPEVWWNTFEVNIRGAYNFFRCVRVSFAFALTSLFRSFIRLISYVSAAATALEQSRGYCVAISSVGAQVRIPGISDMNISKHALNRLVEFIVLGSFLSLLIRSEAKVPDSLPPRRAQSIPVCARFHFRLGLSLRVCTSSLESMQHSIQSSCPLQRRSISHLGARTGFLEGPCQLQTRLFCNDTHARVRSFKVLLHKLGYRRGGVRLERCDSRAESAC